MVINNSKAKDAEANVMSHKLMANKVEGLLQLLDVNKDTGLCCSVLQCVAVCCKAMCSFSMSTKILVCVAVCCSVFHFCAVSKDTVVTTHG